MALLSILIPCFEDEHLLEQTLLSVLPAVQGDVEVVVMDRSGYQDPYGLADAEIELIEAPQRATFCDLIQMGLRNATAPVVHIVGAGIEVESGWYEPALSWFDDSQIGAVIPACWDGDLNARSKSIGLGVKANRTGRRVELALHPDRVQDDCHGLGVDGPAWYAAFYRRELLSEVGGFNNQFGQTMADLDVAYKIQDADLCCMIEPRCELAHRLECEEIEESSFSIGRNEMRLLNERARISGHPVQKGSLVEAGLSLLSPHRLLALAGRCFENRVAGPSEGEAATVRLPQAKVDSSNAEAEQGSDTGRDMVEAPPARRAA